MKILIGILSYLPEDEKVRQKRLNYHNKQLDELKQYYPTAYIYCVYQQYKDTEIPKDKINEYKTFDKGIGVSSARNEILKYYYSSDFDLLFMLDDDSLLYPYYESQYFFEDLLSYQGPDYQNIMCIIPLTPMMTPFKQKNMEYPNLTTHWLLEFNKNSIQNCGVYIITKYMKSLNILMDDKMEPAKGTGHEDIDFCLNLISKGYRTYIGKQLIAKRLTQDESVIYKSRDDRIKLFQQNMNVIYDKYKSFGCEMMQNGRLDLTNMYSRCINPKVIQIPRSHIYTLEENLVYTGKYSGSKAKKLFTI